MHMLIATCTYTSHMHGCTCAHNILSYTCTYMCMQLCTLVHLCTHTCTHAHLLIVFFYILQIKADVEGYVRPSFLTTQESQSSTSQITGTTEKQKRCCSLKGHVQERRDTIQKSIVQLQQNEKNYELYYRTQVKEQYLNIVYLICAIIMCWICVILICY